MRMQKSMTGILVAVLASLAAGAANADIPAPRQAELRHLLTQDCGSCHGLTLKGGLGPPLTQDALRGKTAASLQAVILHGRTGTPMAPWGRFVTEAEALWLAEQLLSGSGLDAR